MGSSLAAFLPHINDTRYHAQPKGHYESFFQRANHPSRPLAFWIRYTLFSPSQHPEQAVGELWAIFFNGETGNHVVVKRVAPLSECVFSSSSFQVQVAGASLQQGQLQGDVQMEKASIAWDLTYQSEETPLLLFPLRLYNTGLPAAKSLVGTPLAAYQGKLVVNGEVIELTLPEACARGFFLQPSGLTTITRVRALEVQCPEALRRSEERPVPVCPTVRSKSKRTQRKEQAVRQVCALLRASTLPIALQDVAQWQTR